MLLSLTTEWVNLEELIEENSGFFVSGGVSIELSTTLDPPSTTNNGIIINRNSFFNVYPNTVTYVRSTAGSATIILEDRFLNYKQSKIATSYLGVTIIIDLIEETVEVFYTSSATVSGLMSAIKTIITNFGYSFIATTTSLGLFQVADDTAGKIGIAQVRISTANGTFDINNPQTNENFNTNTRIIGQNLKFRIQKIN